MSNPDADFPDAIHSPVDTSAFGGSALGETAVTHTDVHGKIEEEIVATQTKVGTGNDAPTAGDVLVGQAAGASQWRQLSSDDVSDTIPLIIALG